MIKKPGWRSYVPRTGRHLPPTSSARPGQRDRLSAGPEALFVYGTLRFPDVLHALLDRQPAMSPARVAGWRAVTLAGRPYPALVPSPDVKDQAEGLLLEGIQPDEWRILDDFEDDVYDLVPLNLLDGRTGWSYVCRDHEGATEARWDFDSFAQQELAMYVDRCRAWRSEHGRGSSAS
jgi:gamma-glutamylcyclotransferase (GGCT)/AIG2-like uncharacterized protein YtfP